VSPINCGLVKLSINHKYKVEVVIMKAVWIAFICGFLLGGMIGISLMCLLSIKVKLKHKVLGSHNKSVHKIIL